MKIATGVYCYILISNLMFIISKLLLFIIFWANLVPKFRTGVHCLLLITILIFIFSKFCQSYNFEQIWRQHLMLIWYKGTFLYADYGFDLQFFQVFTIHKLLGKFHPKTCCSPYLLKFSLKIRCNFINLEKIRFALNLSILFWTRKFKKTTAFKYNQHTILRMYAHARFHSVWTTSDFGTKSSQNYMNVKNFEKINIKIIIST